MSDPMLEALVSIELTITLVERDHGVPNGPEWPECPLCIRMWPCPPAQAAQWLRRLVLENQ